MNCFVQQSASDGQTTDEQMLHKEEVSGGSVWIVVSALKHDVPAFSRGARHLNTLEASVLVISQEFFCQWKFVPIKK